MREDEISQLQTQRTRKKKGLLFTIGVNDSTRFLLAKCFLIHRFLVFLAVIILCLNSRWTPKNYQESPEDQSSTRAPCPSHSRKNCQRILLHFTFLHVLFLDKEQTYCLDPTIRTHLLISLYITKLGSETIQYIAGRLLWRKRGR